MILDINMPQRGCFVGLMQRFVVFCLNICGFTLIFIKTLVRLDAILKQRVARIVLTPSHRPPLPSQFHSYLTDFATRAVALIHGRNSQAKVLFQPQPMNRSIRPT